jgi:glyoxylase-like metal-dependent hydrolase (beta-lactamase superfamily II)
MQLQASRARGRTIGDIEITPLWDGPLPTGFDKIPDPAHRAEAEALVAKAGPGALVMEVYAFLLKIGDRYAIIDTGAGELMPPDLGKLPSALRTLGVIPAQIEKIFMTHLHRDHYGGLADAEGKAASFPNAELLVHEKEAAFWLDSRREDLGARALRHYESAMQFLSLYAKRTRRVKDNESILGLTPHLAPGHTPGHTCWLAQSKGQSLLAWGDLIHLTAIHLPAPHIAMQYDLDPKLALQSRLRVLDWVTREKIPVAGAHLPAPGIGAIVRSGNGYAYEPDRTVSHAA